MATLDSIADEIGYSRNELMQSMVKFGLTNRDWRNEGLTAHKRLPRYEVNPMATKPPSPAQLAARERFAEMARNGSLNRKRQIAAKKRAKNPVKKTVSEKISQLVHEGYPQKQAVAVALNEQRAGKVKSNPAKSKYAGFKYCVESHRYDDVWLPIAYFANKIQADDYMNAIKKSHPRQMLRIKTHK